MNAFKGLLFLLYLLATAETNNECDVHCICAKFSPGFRKAVCGGKMLNYIPKLPWYINVLTIQNGNLTELGEFSFQNLSSSKLSKLTLSGNEIRNVDSQAFSTLPKLKSFTLENETFLEVDMLTKALENVDTTKMKNLVLSSNGWNHIPNNTFVSFADRKLLTLTLSGNNLPIISWFSFKYLKHCYRLNLSSNKMKQMILIHMHNLRRLKLYGNRLTEIPNFCDGNESFVPLLHELNLNRNNIGYITKGSFRCLPRLEILKLDGVSIRTLENNVFQNLLSLTTLTLNDITTLKRIEDFAFNISTLKKLRMSNTKFRFERLDRFNPETIFKSCPLLSYVNLDRNYFTTRQDILQTMLSPLFQLDTLILSSTGLFQLPENTFMHLPKLRRLILFDNRLHKLDGKNIFNNVTSLKLLELSSNLFTLINKTSFPKEMLDSLEEIGLSLNPFSCSCYQRWFFNWIKTTKLKILLYPEYYKCRTPYPLNGLRLDNYSPTDAICNPWNPLYTMAIVLSMFGSLTTAIIVLLCKCHVNIKNYIYLKRVRYSRNKGNILSEDPTDYDYDAFVVYCDSDRLWVHKKFLHKMEKEEGVRLCIHHRNFDAGETITGNVDKYLQKCWKVIVIMSNNFAKSEWCQWEIDVVQERRRRQGKDVFLLIMLKNIDSKHMTSQLRTLLDSTPHLRYQTGMGENLFWKAAVETIKKPLGHPPIAVL